MNNNSDVLFTIGNHDYRNIILKKSTDRSAFKFKHTTSLIYFDQEKNNPNTKMYDIFNLFYSISPYLLLVLKYNNVNEFMCTHAGFLRNNALTDLVYNDDIVSNVHKLIDFQNKLNNTQNFDTFDGVNLSADINYIQLMDGLETKDYINIECDKTHLTEMKNTTIVIGHCPTNIETITRINKLEHARMQPAYDTCSKNTADSVLNGCVVADCFNNDKPQLIFVDTAMSHAFRDIDETVLILFINEYQNLIKTMGIASTSTYYKPLIIQEIVMTELQNTDHGKQLLANMSIIIDKKLTHNLGDIIRNFYANVLVLYGKKEKILTKKFKFAGKLHK